jgi:hypothetical protein
MSKVVKGVGKAIKGIGKAVKKVYKKVVESKIGKALLIGATIYLGGAALGAWNAPGALGAKINGALVKGAAGGAAPSAASQVAASGTTAQLAPGAGVLAPSAGGGAAGVIPAAQTAGQSLAASVMPEAVGGTVGAAGTTAGASAASGVMLPGGLGAAAEGAGEAAGKGILNRLLAGASEKLKATAGFVDKHPYATAMALNAVGNMGTPDQIDIMQAEQDREDKERRRREANLDVSGINLGVSPNGQGLTYTDGSAVFGRGGILNHNVPRSF